MKNINLRPFWFLLAGVSAAVLFLAARLQGYDLRQASDLFRLVPQVATADGLAYFLFATWIWRWRPLQGWLVPFPDLSGTWEGELKTSWQAEERGSPGTIAVMLTVRQKFGRVSCVMRTAEMESRSYLEGFSIDKNEQVAQLCYCYTSRPNVTLRDRSTPHDGTVLLRLIGSPPSKLEGEYWTQRRTVGLLTLRFRTRKVLDALPTNNRGGSTMERP